MLLGVKAVIAESFERIHRSNLVNMGVLPLQFKAGESPASLGLTGREVFDLVGSGAALDAARQRDGACARRATARRRSSRRSCASTRRRSSRRSGTAGSCRTSRGGSRGA